MVSRLLHFYIFFIVFQAKICESWLALFPPRCVEKPRRSLGYVCVFRLASRKNSVVDVSHIVTWRTIWVSVLVATYGLTAVWLYILPSHKWAVVSCNVLLRRRICSSLYPLYRYTHHWYKPVIVSTLVAYSSLGGSHSCELRILIRISSSVAD